MLMGLLKDGFWLAALRIAGAVLSFGMTVLLTRVLDIAAFGAYAYALALIIFGQVFITNGWGTMLVKYASQSHQSGAWSQTRSIAHLGGRLSLCYTGALAGVAVIFWLVPAQIFPINLSLIGVAAVLLSILISQNAALRIAILRGLNRPVLSQLTETIVRPILICLLIFGGLVWLPSITLDAALVIYCIATFISYGIGLWLLNRVAPPALTSARVNLQPKVWIPQSLPFVGSATLTLGLVYVDILVLGFFADLEQVGQYRLAGQIAILSSLAYAALNMIANQRFAFFHKADDWRSIAQTARTLARISFVVSLILPIFFYVAGPSLIALIFGAQYKPAFGPMMVLFALPVINSFFGMPRALLMMVGQQKRELILTGFAIALNLFLCLILIPKFGIWGASVAVVCATFIWCAALWYQALRTLNVDTSVMGVVTHSQAKRNVTR